MIGEALDRIVGVFSPALAVKRMQSRAVMQGVRRSYDAAKIDRNTAYWNTANKSADLELLEAADTVRARARSLVRNNAYAKGILRAIVRNVVGCGITPESRIEGAEATNLAAEKLWNRWQRQCDITGRLSFYEVQSLALSEVIEAGEILIHFVTIEDRSRPLPLALELVEADRLATDWFPRGTNPDTGNEVRRGVEVDSYGRPVAYWIYESHPTDINSFRQVARRYPADEFVHLFRQERVGQTRGVSDFAPIVRWLKDLHYYVENEMQSSAVASCFTAAIKSVGGPADGGILGGETTSTDTTGNTLEYIQPGLVARLMPGEDIEVINPGRGHTESSAWIDLMLRSMAVGVGLSYERLSRDYSKTNYSSNRASDLEDRREFRPRQEWLISHLCEAVWRRFMVVAAVSEVPGLPSVIDLATDFDKWTTHIWQAPGWEWVDPVKEQKASADAIASNLSTLANECAKRGFDWREILMQRAKEKQFAEALGVEDTADAMEPADSVEPQDDSDDTTPMASTLEDAADMMTETETETSDA